MSTQNTSKKIKYQSNKKNHQNSIENNKVVDDISHMPNQKWHKYVSFIKSGVRIIGYGFIPFNLTIACVILILSEVIGIIEEMV